MGASAASFHDMTRTELHRLVDELPEASLEAACVMLRLAWDPLVAGLEAAVHEDPPFTGAEDGGIEEGWAAYQRGEAFTSASCGRRRGPTRHPERGAPWPWDARAGSLRR